MTDTNADYESMQAQIRGAVATAPMGALQFTVVGICVLLNMIDGMDVLIISYIAPVLAEEWSLPARHVGWIFSAGLAGMMAGCLILAPFADAIGRRRLLLLSTSAITVGMAASALVASFEQLLVARVIAGVGIGGILPTMAAMATEFSNERNRNFSVALVQSGWPIGAIVTGLFAAAAIDQLGWRGIFVVSAIVSAAMIPAILIMMPESLEFLAKRQPPDAKARINQVLQRMRITPLTHLVQRPTARYGGRKVRALLDSELRRATIALWVGIFFGFVTLYTLISWVPSFARTLGMPIEQSIHVGTVLNMGSFIGSALIGWLSLYFGLKRSIAAFMATATMLMLAYAYTPLAPTLMFVLVFFIGMTLQGGFNGYYPAAARVYPTDLRATGIGWAMGAGRSGAIAGPLLAGYLQDAGFETQALFVVFSVPIVISACAVMAIPAARLR